MTTLREYLGNVRDRLAAIDEHDCQQRAAAWIAELDAIEAEKSELCECSYALLSSIEQLQQKLDALEAENAALRERCERMDEEQNELKAKYPPEET